MPRTNHPSPFGTSPCSVFSSFDSGTMHQKLVALPGNRSRGFLRTLAEVLQRSTPGFVRDDRPARELGVVPEVIGRQRWLPLIALGTIWIADAVQGSGADVLVAGWEIHKDRARRLADHGGDLGSDGSEYEDS